MATDQFVQDLSFPVKVYVFVLHLLLLFLVVLFLQKPFKRRNGQKDGRKNRTITKDDRSVTIESCEWVNSTLAWFYFHSEGKEFSNVVRLWIRALNKQLHKEKSFKKYQRIIIDDLCPGCLPPQLTSVYCLCVSGNMQCITFHVESVDLGFVIHVLQETDAGPILTNLEMRVCRLSGEVALHLTTAPSRLEVSAQFIGHPEVALSTKYLAKGQLFNVLWFEAGAGNDVVEQTEEKKLQCVVKKLSDSPEINTMESDVDAEEVQEKVKEVICKTITNIPLSEVISKECFSETRSKMKTSVVQIENNYFVSVYVYVFMSGRCRKSSATSKERLNSSASVSCLGEEGKLLVKVIKASGLCGKGLSGPISPYCIVSTANPLQRKRTSTIRDNSNPFWNEYFTFDISAVTKEITVDIYDYEKTGKDVNSHMDDNEHTEEQDDYLGQVIVPLSTVNRDQTCRLILPILPKSSKSDHSKGDISFEFTFDKEGKVVDATLLLAGLEPNLPSFESPIANTSPSVESPVAVVNAREYTGELNGRIPSGKRYIETSLDELSQEIEAYEAMEVRQKKIESQRKMDFFKLSEEPRPMFVPSHPVTEVVTPELVPAQDTEPEEQTPETPPKEMPAEEIILVNTEDKSMEGPEDQPLEAEVEKNETYELEKKEEEELKTPDEHEESSENVSELCRSSSSSSKPKLRRSFNLFRKRPVSMSAADRKGDGEEDRGLSRGDPVRHSYHAGDLPVPELSTLRKSTSQSSLLSYSPNPYSTLVIETVNKGEKKYSHIPPIMARRKAYDKGGNKLHIYNNHIFTAVHFTGSSPDCAVCGKAVKGKIGKQGYKCRECKMVSHRECHCETTVMCTSDAVQNLNIEYVGDTEV